jgi:hypothetical protein
MAHFLPCPGCSRHVRASGAACPFCGAGLPLSNNGTQRFYVAVRPTRTLNSQAVEVYESTAGATWSLHSTQGYSVVGPSAVSQWMGATNVLGFVH